LSSPANCEKPGNGQRSSGGGSGEVACRRPLTGKNCTDDALLIPPSKYFCTSKQVLLYQQAFCSSSHSGDPHMWQRESADPHMR
jgi:hypothetical protein